MRPINRVRAGGDFWHPRRTPSCRLELDKTHPLYNKLYSAVLGSEVIGGASQVFKGGAASILPSTYPITYEVDEGKPRLRANADDLNRYGSLVKLPDVVPAGYVDSWAVISRTRPTKLSTQYEYIVLAAIGRTGAYSQGQITLGVATDGTSVPISWYLMVRNSSYFTAELKDVVPAVEGETETVGLIIPNGQPPASVKFFIGNNSYSPSFNHSSWGGSSPNFYSTEGYLFGSTSWNYVARWQGYFDYLYNFTELTEDEYLWIKNDPYSLFRPANERIWAPNPATQFNPFTRFHTSNYDQSYSGFQKLEGI